MDCVGCSLSEVRSIKIYLDEDKKALKTFEVKSAKSTFHSTKVLWKFSPRVNLLFINAFLRKFYTRQYFQTNFALAEKTVVEWRSFCCEVCKNRLDDQAREVRDDPGCAERERERGNLPWLRRSDQE
ncbi:hypothetical protein GWK47_010424 [Chionoecetes opilio]|uniref:Uncharacterized protein n=1 Tax=Chionoecetes opilio TaxID=41210 RepID=A0A8J5CN22_CHIOP|nr:hypothetical protein GWK47_010424 [Chionoecetes opilio]